MAILYLDCGMGAAGDMLCAALLELVPDKNGFVEKLNQLEIPGVQFLAEPCVRAGITGTHLKVTVHGEEECGEEHEHGHHHHDHHHEDHAHDHAHHHHHHSGMADISAVVERLPVPEKTKQDVMGVYRLIAEAESTAHGVPVSEIHFHEVGSMDAVADITAFCLLVNELMPEKIIASPVRSGSGSVRCAHGILPVPAPATAHILKGVPVFAGEIAGEMCTPTGAALLKHFAAAFIPMPAMTISRIGYGMGRREYPTANCVRALLGEEMQAAPVTLSSDARQQISRIDARQQPGRPVDSTDTICQLSCNVDDMTAEEIGFAMDRLFEAGANEVFTIPAGMKKSRPGTVISVICKPDDIDKMRRILFAHTTTIGIREAVLNRSVLERTVETVQTAYGPVRKKISTGYGVTKMKYEYEDLARIAAENNMSIRELRKELEQK